MDYMVCVTYKTLGRVYQPCYIAPLLFTFKLHPLHEVIADTRRLDKYFYDLLQRQSLHWNVSQPPTSNAPENTN
jgi:hypothetical protein